MKTLPHHRITTILKLLKKISLVHNFLKIIVFLLLTFNLNKRKSFWIYTKIDKQKFVSNHEPTECQVSFELPNLWNTLDYNQNIAQSVR